MVPTPAVDSIKWKTSNLFQAYELSNLLVNTSFLHISTISLSNQLFTTDNYECADIDKILMNFDST